MAYKLVFSIAIGIATLVIAAYIWYRHRVPPGPPGPFYPIEGRSLNFDGTGGYIVIGASDQFALSDAQPMRITFDVASREPTGGFVLGMLRTTTEYLVIWLDVETGINFRVVTRGTTQTRTVTISSGHATASRVLDGNWHSIAFAVSIPVFTHQIFALTVDDVATAPIQAGGMAVRKAVVHVGNRPTGVLAEFGAALAGCVRNLKFNGVIVQGATVGRVSATCKL
jgi:hypothetical protein